MTGYFSLPAMPNLRKARQTDPAHHSEVWAMNSNPSFRGFKAAFVFKAPYSEHKHTWDLLMTINIPQAWTPPLKGVTEMKVWGTHRGQTEQLMSNLHWKCFPNSEIVSSTLSPLSPVSVDHGIHFRDVGFVGDGTQLIQLLAVQKEIFVPKVRQWGRRGEKQDEFRGKNAISWKAEPQDYKGKLLSPGCSSQHSHSAPCTRPASCSLGKPPPKFTKCHFQHWPALRWWFLADLFGILCFVNTFFWIMLIFKKKT